MTVNIFQGDYCICKQFTFLQISDDALVIQCWFIIASRDIRGLHNYLSFFLFDNQFIIFLLTLVFFLIENIFSTTVFNKALSSVVIKSIKANPLALLSLLQPPKGMWRMWGSSFRKSVFLVIATVHSCHFLIVTINIKRLLKVHLIIFSCNTHRITTSYVLWYKDIMLLLLLSHISRVRLCATP